MREPAVTSRHRSPSHQEPPLSNLCTTKPRILCSSSGQKRWPTYNPVIWVPLRLPQPTLSTCWPSDWRANPAHYLAVKIDWLRITLAGLLPFETTVRKRGSWTWDLGQEAYAPPHIYTICRLAVLQLAKRRAQIKMPNSKLALLINLGILGQKPTDRVSGSGCTQTHSYTANWWTLAIDFYLYVFVHARTWKNFSISR